MAIPLTFIIELASNALIWGGYLHWKGFLLYTLIASVFAWLG